MKKLLAIIIFFLMSTHLFSLDYITSPLVSGIYEDIAVMDNTAYLATQWCVMILDVTDKTNPDLVNIVPFNMAYYLEIHNNFLFVSTLISSFGTYDNKTSLYDISNPHEPILISEIYESAQRFALRDSLLFMQTQEFSDDELLYKLKIFNISNLNFPSQVAEIDSVKSFDFTNNYLYTINTLYNESEIHLNIYDMADIHNISLLNKLSLPLTNASNNDPYLLIDDDVMYITEWNSYYILDIASPQLPVIMNYTEEINLMQYHNNFVKYHNDLFLAGGKIIDVSDPQSPFIAGNYDPPWPPGNVITSVDIYDDNLYVSNWEYGYYFMDISNPLQPIMIYCYESIDYYFGIDIEADRAYVSSAAGVTILDISAPEESYVLGSYPYLDWSEDICVDNDMAYVACDYGFVVLNVSDPANIYPVGDYQGCLTRLVKNGNYVYAVDNIWGVLEAFDVSNPYNVQYIGGYDFADNPNALCLQDDLLFIADANEHNYLINYNGGLRIIDISDPWNLERISTTNPDTMRYYRSITEKDSYVFMGSNEPGIYVFDVSNPAEPHQVNYIESSRASYALEVKDNYLFNGVQIFDISDINNIILIDSCTSACGSGIPWSIAAEGQYIFEASTYAVSVYSSDVIVGIDDEPEQEPSSILQLSQNYPNPFNINTTIEFVLKEKKKVRLSIYTIKGERVDVPIDATLCPGTFSIEWNGQVENRNNITAVLPNGVYLYKLQAGDDSVVKKLLLLR
jgi:hypothetical protein